jgi:hypothetical protein
LDYRPEAHPPKNVIAKKNDDDHDDDNAKMLKSYVDQWTTINATTTEPTDADHNPRSINSKDKSRGKKEEKRSKSTTTKQKETNTSTTKKKDRVDEELIDDPSSSVVSSSEDSYHHDDCGDDGGDFDAEVHSTDGPAFESKKFDGHSLGCNDGEDRLPLRQSWEYNIESPLPQTNTKEQMEVEYGKLAVLMQELEHQKQLQRRMDGNVESNVANTLGSVPLPFLTGGLSSSSMTTTEKDDAETIQKELQVEYGRLAFLNNELKRKMEMMNATTGVTDPCNYHDGSERLPSFTAPGQTNIMMATSSSQGGQNVKESLALEYGQLAFLQHELDRKMQLQKMYSMQVNPIMNNKQVVRGDEKGSAFMPEKLLLRDASSSRDDDVAFGEMVYKQRMAQTADSFKHRSGDDEEVPLDHEPHARRRRERYPLQRETMDYDAVHHDYDNEYRKVGRMRSSSSASKRKKKRKRRVVETITRVIHEESEEEGSSSTGGRHNLNYQYHSPRKYHRNEDDDDYCHYDDMSSGERRHKVKRSSDYRKRYLNNLSPTTDSRIPKRKRDMMNHEHADEEFSSSDDDDVRGRTAKRHGKKQTYHRGRHGGHTSPSSVKKVQKRTRSVSKNSSPSVLESLH